MTRQQLFQLIQKKQSFLCIGLDTDMDKIPGHLKKFDDPVFEFNKQIIDATHAYAIAYKPNLAFYEAMGAEGWKSLEKTMEYLKLHNVFTIADAKRGDIGNTSKMYARAFLQDLDFDAITVAPYMGIDSVSPFLEYDHKWIIVLALTSNQGAADFQLIQCESSSNRLFEEVISKSSKWGNPNNMMYVVGATKAEMLADIRKIIPDHFLLVPGVGAQGGDLEAVAMHGLNDHCGIIVNSSRGIIYASSGEDFGEMAEKSAVELQQQMEAILIRKKLI